MLLGLIEKSSVQQSPFPRNDPFLFVILRACDFFDLFRSQHMQPLFINRHPFLAVIPSEAEGPAVRLSAAPLLHAASILYPLPAKPSS
jgi:hypothetical protein